MQKEKRKIVIPSQVLGDVKSKKAGRGTFVENGKIYSEILGVLNENDRYINVVALKGRYNPVLGDFVIGVVLADIPLVLILKTVSALAVIGTSAEITACRMEPSGQVVLTSVCVGRFPKAVLRYTLPTASPFLKTIPKVKG